MPTLPTPPSSPTQLDSVLAGAVPVATGRTATWVITGAVDLQGTCYFSHEVINVNSPMYPGCNYSATYDLGPFPQQSGLTPIVMSEAVVSIGNVNVTFGGELTCVPQSYQQQYTVRDPPNHEFHDSNSETVPNATWSGPPAPMPIAAIAEPWTPAGLMIPGNSYVAYYPWLYVGYAPLFLGTAGMATFAYDTTTPPPPSVTTTFRINIGSSIATSGPITCSETARVSGPVYTQTGTGGVQGVALGALEVDLGMNRFDVTDPGASFSVAVSNDLSVQSMSEGFTITIHVAEQFVTYDRQTAAYVWQMSNVSCSCGGQTASLPIGVGQYVDCVATAGVSVSVDGDFSGYPGFSPNFENTLSGWSLSGTTQGLNFTDFPGTVTSNKSGLMRGTIAPSSITVAVEAGSDSPVSSTSTDPSYGWYVSDVGPGSGSGTPSITNCAGGVEVILTPTTSTRFRVVEEWWDSSTYLRTPTDPDGLRIAAYLQFWNTLLANAGSFANFTNGHGVDYVWGVGGYYGPSTFVYNGFVTGYPTAGLDGILVLSSGDDRSYSGAFPESGLFPYLTGNPTAPAYADVSQLYVYCPSESWYTNTGMNRVLGQLTITKSPNLVTSDTFSVSSTATQTSGNSNRTTDTTLGQWSGQRYLTVNCTGVVLADGDFVTLTFETAGGQSGTYTLNARPDGSGHMSYTIDLAAPDGLYEPGVFFGDGIGLISPAPTFTPSSGPPYYRATSDGVAAAAAACVNYITIAVPGPSESCHVASWSWDPLDSDYATGTDAFVDQHNDGLPSGPVNTARTGSLTILQDGKRALRYPFYGSMTGNPGNWLNAPVALMVSDFIYDLQVLDAGMSASLSVSAVGVTLTANDIPIGLIVTPSHEPFGQNAYVPWASSSKAFPLRRELATLQLPAFCCEYDATLRWRHGGGLEGLAYYPSGKPFASTTIAIKHADRPATSSYASNAPTGTASVATDIGGFFRTMYYDEAEEPAIKGLGYPPASGPPAVPNYAGIRGDMWPFVIMDITYNHFAAVINPVIPRTVNLARKDGAYHEAFNALDSYGRAQGLSMLSCDTGAPYLLEDGSPVMAWRDGLYAAVIDNNAGSANPSITIDHSGRLYCCFDRQIGGGSGTDRIATSYECYSDDDGGFYDPTNPTLSTWSKPAEMAITNGQYPMIRCGQDGSIYRVAYVDDGTNMGTGTLWGQYQAPGDPTPSTPFQLTQADGLTPIAAQLGAFGLDHLAESASRWILTVLGVTDGTPDTAPTEWVSADDVGGTFTRLDGTDSGTPAVGLPFAGLAGDLFVMRALFS